MSANQIETQAEQAARITEEGVSLSAACDPWRLYPVLSLERLLRAFVCGGQRDTLGWLGFMNVCVKSDSAFFESQTGWICLQNIRPGASAEVHGGAFEKRRGSNRSIDAPTIALLDYLQNKFNLPVLLSFYAEHNLGAAHWDKKFGFKQMGVIPLQDYWAGLPRNVIITARFKTTEDVEEGIKSKVKEFPK